MSDKLRSNAEYSIPDDPDGSTYRYIIVASKCARQLQMGSRSFLPMMQRKPTAIAMEEVRRGLVFYKEPVIAGS